jgi:hypothetical protein
VIKQRAGARRNDYGLRINKSVAMEPCICGLPPALIVLKYSDPHTSLFVTRHVKLELLKGYSNYLSSRNTSHRLVCLEIGYLNSSNIFFNPMPTHVPYGLRGLPSRLWPKCNRLLRLGRPSGAVTLCWWGGWIWSAGRGLKPKLYWLPRPWSPCGFSSIGEKSPC